MKEFQWSGWSREKLWITGVDEGENKKKKSRKKREVMVDLGQVWIRVTKAQRDAPKNLIDDSGKRLTLCCFTFFSKPY